MITVGGSGQQRASCPINTWGQESILSTFAPAVGQTKLSTEASCNAYYRNLERGEMGVILERRNHKTGGIVQLHQSKKAGHHGSTQIEKFYWMQCEHGTIGRSSWHKSYVIDSIAHPDRWCDKCAKLARDA